MSIVTLSGLRGAFQEEPKVTGVQDLCPSPEKNVTDLCDRLDAAVRNLSSCLRGDQVLLLLDLIGDIEDAVSKEEQNR